MKKLFVVFGLILLSGCTNPSDSMTFREEKANNGINAYLKSFYANGKNLQTNIFSDILNKLVTEKNTAIVETINDKIVTKETAEKFTELNSEIYNLREFLILGETMTDTGLALREINDNYLVNSARVVCTEELNNNGKVKSVDCLAHKSDKSSPVTCYQTSAFTNRIKSKKDTKDYCKFKGEVVFKEGLMKIADTNNSMLVEKFQDIFDLISGKKAFQGSLSREIIRIKKLINKICRKQKVSIVCDL